LSASRQASPPKGRRRSSPLTCQDTGPRKTFKARGLKRRAEIAIADLLRQLNAILVGNLIIV
jgi:hypothetical protein